MSQELRDAINLFLLLAWVMYLVGRLYTRAIKALDYYIQDHEAQDEPGDEVTP